MRAALYTRVSTHDQQTLAMQRDALQEFATRRGWTVIDTVEEIASALGIPAGTVHSRLHYALKRLHTVIDTADDGETLR